MLTKLNDVFHKFKNVEEGLALTEYLILLGLLVGGTILAVGAIGGDLVAAWESLQTWFGGAPLNAPAAE